MHACYLCWPMESNGGFLLLHQPMMSPPPPGHTVQNTDFTKCVHSNSGVSNSFWGVGHIGQTVTWCGHHCENSRSTSSREALWACRSSIFTICVDYFWCSNQFFTLKKFLGNKKVLKVLTLSVHCHLGTSPKSSTHRLRTTDLNHYDEYDFILSF